VESSGNQKICGDPILSWMGMAHALDLEGTARELNDATGGALLLRSSHVV
jgi:hypothetical protein